MKWVLVPVEPTEEMSSHQMPGSWELSLAARPPVSREWLEAAVERGAKAIANRMHKGGDYGMQGIDAYEREPEYFGDLSRAAILAALELEDTP